MKKIGICKILGKGACLAMAVCISGSILVGTSNFSSNVNAVSLSETSYNNVQPLENNSTISATTILLGSSVILKGSATGGSSSYKYAFYVKLSSSSKWTELQSYSNLNSKVFKPEESGIYDICIKVKDGNGTIVKSYLNLEVQGLTNTSTVSAKTTSLGNTVTLKGSAKDGKSSYKFAYYSKLTTATSWKELKTYSTTSSISFTPDKVGTYDICIKVKDSTGQIAKKYFTLVVNSKLKNGSKINKTNMLTGETVTMYGSATGGTPSYKYAYYYKNTNTTSWKELAGYSTTSLKTLTINESGTYDICIKVKDADGTIVKNYFKLTVEQKIVEVTSVSLSSNSIDIKVGESKTLNPIISPSDATNKTCTYSSSNTYVATVSSNGVVKGISTGKAIIKIRTANGKETSCTVNVKVNMDSYIDEVVSIVNKQRIANGVPALKKNDELCKYADVRAVEVVDKFEHIRPDGRPFYTVITDDGWRYRNVGENIAMGYRNPEEVMDGWMNSDGHKKNILNENFTDIGVGLYESGGYLYWVQIFYRPF